MSKKSVLEFPELDLSALLNPDFDFAVHCSTDAQALHFIQEVRRQYPRNAWDHNDTRWHDEGGVAYSPYINRGKRMTWESVSHYVNRGFVIIEFEDLIPIEQEIVESEYSIDVLFGGVV